MTGTPIDWNAVEKEAVDLLSRYLQIDTTNPPGNETDGARFLQSQLEKEQIESEVLESRPGRGNVLTKYCGAAGEPEILLLHHIDVVPAEAPKWYHPPFSGRVENGEIWGRGAQDCKFLGIMQLMVFLLLKRRGLEPEKHLVYAATADEEAGGIWGVHWLMEHHPEKLRARSVINEGVGWGFPSRENNLYFCQVAEKGACWMRISFEGRPGHGSLPHGENCLLDMARAVTVLAEHDFPAQINATSRQLIEGLAPEQGLMPPDRFLELLQEGRAHEVLDSIEDDALRGLLVATLQNTAVPTVVQAGGKSNVIPGEGHCEIDCRILPGSDSEKLKQQVHDILTVRGCRNFTITFRGEGLSSESPTDTQLYKAIHDSFLENDPRARVIPYMSPGATDSRFFRDRGIPAYGLQFDLSVEEVQRIHGHNERIGVNQFVLGIKVLYDTIRKCVYS